MKRLSISIKRKILQIAAFGFTNFRVTNFAGGRIYTGKWKQFCAPSMNCYSCPAASFACPIGAMQAVAGSVKFDISFYVLGFVLAAGVIFGRAICGFLCPFGLIQEIINLIPVRNLRLPKWMTYIKYGILAVFVFTLPVALTNFMGMGQPAFCQYLCPVGTLEGGIPLLLTHPELRSTIGGIFFLKAAVLIGVLVACAFVYRFFCKVMCPLGAIYGLLNRISLYHLTVDKNLCISCGKCAKECKMDVDPVTGPSSPECIRCGRCAAKCPKQAIKIGFSNRR